MGKTTGNNKVKPDEVITILRRGIPCGGYTCGGCTDNPPFHKNCKSCPEPEFKEAYTAAIKMLEDKKVTKR